MIRFKVIAGDFATHGTCNRDGFQMIPPGRVFKREFIPKRQIESLEIATQDRVKNLREAAAFGLLGGVVLGPIGAVAGVLLGGNNKEVVFVCHLRDGRKFLAQADAKDFREIIALSVTANDVPRNPNSRRPRFVAGEKLRPPCARGDHYACGFETCGCSCHSKARSSFFRSKSNPLLQPRLRPLTSAAPTVDPKPLTSTLSFKRPVAKSWREPMANAKTDYEQKLRKNPTKLMLLNERLKSIFGGNHQS